MGSDGTSRPCSILSAGPGPFSCGFFSTTCGTHDRQCHAGVLSYCSRRMSRRFSPRRTRDIRLQAYLCLSGCERNRPGTAASPFPTLPPAFLTSPTLWPQASRRAAITTSKNRQAEQGRDGMKEKEGGITCDLATAKGKRGKIVINPKPKAPKRPPKWALVLWPLQPFLASFCAKPATTLKRNAYLSYRS